VRGNRVVLFSHNYYFIMLLWMWFWYNPVWIKNWFNCFMCKYSVVHRRQHKTGSIPNKYPLKVLCRENLQVIWKTILTPGISRECCKPQTSVIFLTDWGSWLVLARIYKLFKYINFSIFKNILVKFDLTSLEIWATSE
jgi:hypothetical protein